jgi:hypothetical protein
MSKAQKIINGLLILNTYPGLEINVSHDELHAGNTTENCVIYSDVDHRDLVELGWRYDTEGFWSIFT